MKKFLLLLVVAWFASVASGYAQGCASKAVAVPKFSTNQVVFYKSTGVVERTLSVPVGVAGAPVGSVLGVNSVRFTNDKLFVGLANSSGTDYGAVLMYTSAQVTAGSNPTVIHTPNNLPVIALAVDGSNNLFVSTAGSGNNSGVICRYTAASSYTTVQSLPVDNNLGFYITAFGGIALVDGNNLWTTSVFDNAIVYYGNINWSASPVTAETHMLKDGSNGAPYLFSLPEGIALDANNNLWVASNNDTYSTHLNSTGNLAQLTSTMWHNHIAAGNPNVINIDATLVGVTDHPVFAPITGGASLLGGILANGTCLYVNNQASGSATSVLNYNTGTSAVTATVFAQTYPGYGGLDTYAGTNFDGSASTAADVTLNFGQQFSISPYIYGAHPIFSPIFSLSNQNGIQNTYTGIPSRRLGGDLMSTYNYENNAANPGANDNNLNSYNDFAGYLGCNSGSAPGCQIRSFHDKSVVEGAYSLVQLPMMGTSRFAYVAADGNETTVTAAQAAPSSRWKQVRDNKPSALTLTPNTADGDVFVDEEINYLSNAYAAQGNKIKGYCLDNEPDIWFGTHSRVVPNTANPNNPVRIDSFMNKSIALAKTVKRIAPNAEVFGPEIEEYNGLLSFRGAPDYANWIAQNPVGVLKGSFAEAYLAQMKAQSQTAGKRLLDVFSFHAYCKVAGVDTDMNDYYSTAVGTLPNFGSRANRIQAVRSFWDPTYVENSYITDPNQWGAYPYGTNGQALKVIPRMRDAVTAGYPGTKLAITEWRMGAGADISGGIAVADALGVFGREGVYFATYHDALNYQNDGSSQGSYPYQPATTRVTYAAAAFDLYRNYTGTSIRFGTQGIKATVTDNATWSVYSSVDDTDPTLLHLIVINKDCDVNGVGTAHAIKIALNPTAGTTFSTTGGKLVYVSATNSPNANVQTGNIQTVTIANNQLSFTASALTAYHIVVKANKVLATEDESPNSPARSSIENINAYPNPTSGQLSLEWTMPITTTANETVTVRVFDMLGQQVLAATTTSAVVGGNQATISLEALPAGMYNVALQAGNEPFAAKRVVKM